MPQSAWLDSVSAQLIGLDLDGTLINHDGGVSPQVCSAVSGAVAAGHHVTIASGRCVGDVLPILTLLGLDRGYAVCSNGAVTIELDPQFPQGFRVVDSRAFNPAETVATLLNAIPDLVFAVENADFVYRSTTPYKDQSFGMEPSLVANVGNAAALRIVATSPSKSPEQFLHIISELELPAVNWSIGWGGWLGRLGTGVVHEQAQAEPGLRAQIDMAAAGVSKASGLEALRVLLNVDAADTVAIGDGENDLEMLAWAACGVAMGQADESIKAAANRVTLPVEEHGAALILDELPR